MSSVLKTCIKCEQAKIIDDFYRHNVSSDGKDPRCKACVRGMAKVYNKGHPIERKAAQKARRHQKPLEAAQHNKKRRDNLSDDYVANAMGINISDFDRAAIMPIIELKREQLKIKRYLRGTK